MDKWLTEIQALPVWKNWDNSIVLITFASLVLWISWRLLYSRLYILTEKTRVDWDNLLLHALQTPVTVLIWCWPASISVGLLLDDMVESELNWLLTLKQMLFILCFIWVFLRLIHNIEQHVLSTKKRDETTVQAIAKIARLAFILTGLLSLMQTFGLSLSGLLTFGGVGGLVVGFAAKDLLSNFFGGLMIYFDRPFKVGDWIRSPDRNIEGTVERIGWRMTIIRTFDKRPLYVPNAVFSHIVVENPSRMLNRRIYETIGLRYDDAEKVSRIIQDVKTMLETHPDIDASQTLIVNFNAFGPSSLDFFIYTFTKTVNWIKYHEVKQDILLRVMTIIHQHDADIAYPTQILKLEPESSGSSEGHVFHPQG
ncbi:Low conductance mechanosensitive channel YnaI [Vibrio aerogenes CECT 7868]|uniref:Low conductance mechanosensitive channel YnaI n=1 Tax=Vibrio aerogenes CECT 7868 TaxID=1216006 RepID=A0A1M5V4A8_9VIBR|nr:mechanosensitive ion channel domain-containing protein [Vibrio aerogenes]SHH70016.1 Low conductance mechanosensitive channel YnaI [Vibrio aerogenes CECT 7868]